MDTLKFQITSRREFERLKSCDSTTLTDLERVARVIYLQTPSFGGKVAGQNFGVDTTGRARFNLTRLALLLENVHERLSGVVIENLELYLDPPYFGSEGDYGKFCFDGSSSKSLQSPCSHQRQIHFVQQRRSADPWCIQPVYLRRSGIGLSRWKWP